MPQVPTQPNQTTPVQMTRVQYQAKYGSVVPSSSPAQTSAPVQMTRAEYQTKYGSQPNPVTQATNAINNAPKTTVPNANTESGNLIKNLVGAPATMIARPIQTIAELGGASADTVDRVTNNLTGGLVAPVPQNAGDVEKDIGRGIQTVALGAGPVSGGTGLGVGNSLEQGNDLFSKETAKQAVIGGLGGKVLDVAGKPILNYAGEKLGGLVPASLKDLATAGSEGISEFAKNTKILPDVVSEAINKGAKTAETLANKPFSFVGDTFKGAGAEIKDIYNKQYPTSVTEEKFNQAKDNIAAQYKKSLPLTPTQQLKEANLLKKTGDNVYTTIAKHGTDLEKLQQVSDQYANATKYAQANETGHFNIDEIKQNAFKNIDQKIPSETARQIAKNKISNEIDAIIKANPDSVFKDVNGETKINADLVERLRKTGNSWTNFNSADPEKVGQSTGYSLSNAVRDQVDKEGTFPAYREANKEWGKIIHAQEVLGNIDNAGKAFKAPGGLSGSISRKILSGGIGYGIGGPAGAVLSEIGSEYGAKILSNPELRTYFDRQVVEKFAGKNPTPEAVTKLEGQIREYIDKQASLKALPAPSYIPMGPETPATSGTIQPRPVSAEELQLAQKATGTTSKPLRLEGPGRNPIRLKGK